MIKSLALEKFLPLHWIPPGNPFRKEVYTTSQRTRIALEELGTTFVKVGQILSTRTDILSSDFTLELTKLQNSLPPLPFETIEKVVSAELGRPVSEVFRSFDRVPLGVASIGQAHAAILQDGTEVVVKVRKPGVEEQVKEDLDILRQLAEHGNQRSQYAYSYKLPSLIEEIADTITSELDYIREGHSAEHFARFFEGNPSIHIPKILWQYSTQSILLLERIRGIGILDLASLDKAKIDRKELARRSVNIWLKMVFEDEMFHADPHPGNMFVEVDGRLGLIDFGMAGMVDGEVRDHLASAVKAIIDRDVDTLLDSIVDMGAVAPENSKENFRADLKHVMGHYPQLADFHLTTNLGEIFSVIRRNHIQLPANTFLLLKTMSMAQSLGKGLDPDFDFFQELKPYIEQIIQKRYSVSATIHRLPSAVSDLVLLGSGLPKRLLRIIKSVDRGEFHVGANVEGLELHLEHLERIVRMMVLGILAAAILLGMTILFLAFKIGS